MQSKRKMLEPYKEYYKTKPLNLTKMQLLFWKEGI